MSKFISLAGLTEFWSKAKNYIDSKPEGPFIINSNLMNLIKDCENDSAFYTGWETDWAELHIAIWSGKQLATHYSAGNGMTTPVIYSFDSDGPFNGNSVSETDYCVNFIWFDLTHINYSYIGIDNSGSTPATSTSDNVHGQYQFSKLAQSLAMLSSSAIANKQSNYAVTGSEAWTKIYADFTILNSGTSMTLWPSSAHTVLVLPTSTTARTITLPSSPTNGEMFVIRKMYTGNAAQVTVKCSSSHSFQMSTAATTYTYSTGYTISSSMYRAVRFLFYSNKWYIIADD